MLGNEMFAELKRKGHRILAGVVQVIKLMLAFWLAQVVKR